jgi:hypothetical protein
MQYCPRAWSNLTERFADNRCRTVQLKRSSREGGQESVDEEEQKGYDFVTCASDQEVQQM